jgi:hypothetical protein
VTTFYTTIAANQVRDYMPATPMMVTATSYWSYGQRRSKARQLDGKIPQVVLPEHVSEVCADSGGFEAAYRHGGTYPFSFETYIDWLETIPNLSWAAMPDLPVEREITASFEGMRERQQLTLDWARDLWGDATDHGEYNSVPWCWVPTIQGREPADYVWMAERMAPLLFDQMLEYDYTAYGMDRYDGDEQWLPLDQLTEAENGAEYRRVGIGSLCRRKAVSEIVPIVKAVAEVLPTHRFHLWGVKLNALGALREAGLLDRIVSIDSAAWNGEFGTDKLKLKATGLSQAQRSWTVAHPQYLAKIQAQLAA